MVRRLGQRTTLLVAMAVQPVMYVVPALTANPWVIAAAFFVSLAIAISWNIVTVSLRQRIVPDHLLGRVNAGYRVMAWGTMPIGAAVGAVVAERWGLTATFWVAAGLSLLCLPIIWSQVTTARLDAAQPEPVAT